MTDDELKKLSKEVKKRKRIATEWAAQVHDLVEERLLEDYSSLGELAENTVAACEAWRDAKARLAAAEKIEPV